MAERTGGELLAESLIQQGVTRIFGIPGVQLDDAADALYARADRIGFTCARNEQATTYMADGYARSTGDVGVAMVVPGPGVLNALSGVATGYSANSPMLLIAGQIDSRAIGKGLGALHELPDQTGILHRLTKWTGSARSADEVPELVAEAFRQLRTGRPRPVALEVPQDVLGAKSGRGVLERIAPAPTVPDEQQIRDAARLLGAARRPLIVVGGRLALAGPLVLDPLIASYDKHTLVKRTDVPPEARTQIVVGKFTENDSCLGAVGLVLRHFGGQEIRY